MTEQEEKNVRLENKVDVWAAKVDAFIEEIRDFKTEMRDRDNQRALEVQALRTEMIAKDNQRTSEINEIRTDIKGIREDMKGLDRYFHNLTITAMVGVGAAVIGVLVGIGSLFFSR